MAEATTIRLTTAQALVRYLQAQQIAHGNTTQPLFAGVWAIFGHGNVAGIGEALYQYREQLPTYRAHNEQAMAHAAIAFAKQKRRRQMMACTTSIGPGALNMVTAAGVAYTNRLPVLLLPGDTFATRKPDPVLQQLEHFDNPLITANDCLKPVSRYFDRISRPEQLLTSLPVAIATLTDPVNCGPVTLAMPQDVQTMAYDFPLAFFTSQVHHIRRPALDLPSLEEAAQILRHTKRPLIIAGGGVLYSEACEQLRQFAETFSIPVAETQAGKGSLAADHPLNVGAIGVTGSSAANQLAQQADVIIAIGSRQQDFTTGSWALYTEQQPYLISLNTSSFDAYKHRALALIGDAKLGLEQLTPLLKNWQSPDSWQQQAQDLRNQWLKIVVQVTKATQTPLPSDAQVIGAVNRQAGNSATVVCAAGGLPGELHKLWQASGPGAYHVEYGFSCMGYEIAGALGVKMAARERDIYVLVGDGSYLMLNSELATSVMLGLKLIVVVLDNRGFGCINRLQQATGNAAFNNLMQDCLSVPEGAPKIDFAAHARALGCLSESVKGITALEEALQRARSADRTYVIALDTDPLITTDAGGAWWDVAVPEVSPRAEVNLAYQNYLNAKQRQH